MDGSPIFIGTATCSIVHLGRKGCGRGGGGVVKGQRGRQLFYVWPSGQGKESQRLQELYYQLTADILTSKM